MTPLRDIGWPWAAATAEAVDLPAWAAALREHPRARPARVTEQHRSGYHVAEALGDSAPVESPPDWQRPRFPPEQRAAVGDWVLVEGSGKSAKIVALLPRRSALKRGAAGEHYRQQLIAANIDTVFVVCGLDADFNPRRIERYLLLVRSGGVEPVVVLTKADQARSADPGAVEAAIAALAEVAAEGTAVVAVNAKDRASIEALAAWLQPGRSIALVGSSGAGKSTLTNTLLGTEKMKTAAVRQHDARGRHTTTHRALVALPGGACLIDTPGMRELKPTGEEDVAESFGDIDALAAQCRFRDCRHDREPGCAVRAAIEAGTLAAERFGNYLKLRDEVAGAANQLATRLQQNAAERGPGKAPAKRPGDRNGRHG